MANVFKVFECEGCKERQEKINNAVREMGDKFLAGLRGRPVPQRKPPRDREENVDK